MPPRPFVNDALWRCLCPAYSKHATKNTHLLGARTPRNLTVQRRGYVEGVAHAKTESQISFAQSTAHIPSNDQSNHPPSAQSTAHIPSDGQSNYPPSAHSRRPRPPQHEREHAREQPPLTHLPTFTLYENLRLAGAKGDFVEAMRICSVLIKDRAQPPDQAMYAAVLHSFTSSTDGTAGKVRRVLEEMGFWAGDEGAEKVELDLRGCENVLEALAVHPDYLLRTEVLEYMRDKWFTLSDRAHGFVVAGLLRERHFEQALEMLEDMCRRKVRVDEWVWSKALWMLLEFGEVEEAFWVLGLKASIAEADAVGAAYGVKLSSALWGALLDAAAQKQLYDAARIVWTAQVQPGYLKPPTGTCMNVLSLASRHGDVQLATDVFRLLTERETIFTTHHYELLIAAYLKADALSDALAVITIMADANLKVDAATCHPLYTYLCTTPAPPSKPTSYSPDEEPENTPMPLHAFTLLQSLASRGKKIPPAAPNTCIQAAITSDNLPLALHMYKSLHTVSTAGANTQTFNLLFRGCAQSARKDVAMRLVDEMMALDVRPDRITYDRLILVCVGANDLDAAVAYYEEMGSEAWRPRRGTYERLINALVDEGDARCVGLLREYRESGEVVSRVERRVREKFVVGHGDAEAVV